MIENFFSIIEKEQYLNSICYGLFVTILISLFTIFFSTILGLLFFILKEINFLFLKYFIKIYITLFKNTPLLMQLFFWYFAANSFLPTSLIKWLKTSHHINIINISLINLISFEFLIGLIGLTIYSIPFIVEELKSGMLSIKKNQKIEAMALGLSKITIWKYIFFPQILKNSYIPILGQYMNIIKNSSLTMAIGVTELSYISRQIESESFQTFTIFIITTILYILIIGIIEIIRKFIQ
ncbi:MAG: ABC transporter permease subunit [Arsenophonus sp.]|nr:MAG: ABC transporter permease subunit [Arsenophonus sp.]